MESTYNDLIMSKCTLDIVHETLDLLSGSGLGDPQSDEYEFIRSKETESQKGILKIYNDTLFHVLCNEDMTIFSRCDTTNLTGGLRGIKHLPATSRGSTIHEQAKIKIRICVLVGLWYMNGLG